MLLLLTIWVVFNAFLIDISDFPSTKWLSILAIAYPFTISLVSNIITSAGTYSPYVK